ncbi:MAG: DUF433 domain-containing protein [Chloroflexi bacterium]|nr:DUF433 domain-containing protein [Chloroflexota bacterium]
MATIAHTSEDAPWLDRLHLPAYRVTEAAKYASIHHNTIYAWERTASPDAPRRPPRAGLSYLELIEIAFVAFFKSMGIPLRRIRQAHDQIAGDLETAYPFTSLWFKTERPYYHLLIEQSGRYLKAIEVARVIPIERDEAPLLGRQARVVLPETSGRYSQDDWVAEWFSRFDYEYEVVARWRLKGNESQVVIDPRVSFGAPTAAGIPTRVIAGRCEAGETPNDIASDFAISEAAVWDALYFENLGHLTGQTRAS